MRAAARAVLVATLLLTAACQDAFFFDPAPGGSGSLAVQLSAALAGPGEAFDQADNVLVRVTEAGSGEVLHDEQVPYEDGGSVSVTVEIDGEEAAVVLDVEVRMGSAALFRATENVTLATGATTTVTANLQPVPMAIEVPTAPPALTSYGDTVFLDAAAVFTTGDTIPGLVPSWSSQDPDILEVGQRTDGRWVAVARSDGTARLTASLQGLQGALDVEVRATVVEVQVSPASVEIDIDAEVQLAAVPHDARGHTIPGRLATWTSRTPSIASVDDSGRVRGEGPGGTVIDAEVEGVTGSADVTVRPGVPTVQTLAATDVADGRARLRGTVNPNGQATQAWFEWGTDPSLANASETATQDVGSGETPVAVEALLAQLPQQTTFYFRVVASSPAGETRGLILSFQTPTPPAAPSGLNLSYDGGVYVRWTDNSTDEATFEVERAATVPGSPSGAARQVEFEQIAVVGPGVEEYFDEEAPTGTLQYRVRACSAVWCSAYTPPESIVVTAPPAVGTAPPSEVNPNSARLVGTVNPMGSTTFAWFQWSTDPGLTSAVTTKAVSVGSGSGVVAFDALVENLSAGFTYYYRAVAENAGGTAVGQVRSFQTPVPPAVPVNVEADYDEVGVRVVWDDVSANEVRFEIQREWMPFQTSGAEGGGPLPVYVDVGVVPANTTTFNDPDPPFGYLYYRVRACSLDACSDYSAPAQIAYEGN